MLKGNHRDYTVCSLGVITTVSVTVNLKHCATHAVGHSLVPAMMFFEVTREGTRTRFPPPTTTLCDGLPRQDEAALNGKEKSHLGGVREPILLYPGESVC